MSISSWLSFLHPLASRQRPKQGLGRPRVRRRLHVEPLEDRHCPSGSHLLVADFGGDKVLRYDGANGAFVDTFVPRHSGGMNQPYGVLFGPDGNGDGQPDLYVSTGENAGPGQLKAVLRYDGVSGTFIDEFTKGGDLQSPNGIIFGPDGKLYVASGTGGFGGRVARYDGITGAFLGDFVPPGSGGLRAPSGIVFGPSGKNPAKFDLYVSSRATHNILRYDGTTGAFLGEFVVGGSGGLDTPQGLMFGPDGNLYVASSAILNDQARGVLRFQGPAGSTPGAFMDKFVSADSGGLKTPFGLIFGPDGNRDGCLDLYVTSSRFNGTSGNMATVKRFDGVTGTFIDTFVTEGSGKLDDAQFLTFPETDPMTLAYDGGSPTAAAEVPGPLRRDTAVGLQAASPGGGFLLVADYDNHKVLRYDETTGAFVDEFVPKHSGGLNQPQMLVFGPYDHDLYVSSGHFVRADQHRGVLRYDGTTGAFAGEASEDGHLESVHYIIFGPDGNLYVGDRPGSYGHHAGGRIVRFDGKTGAFLDDFVATDSGGLKHPFGLVFGPGGAGPSGLDLYVANGPGNVLRYDGQTGAFSETFVATASGGLDFPAGLTFGPDGNLYVASAVFRGGLHGIMRFQGPAGPTPGAFIDLFVPLGSGGLLSPTGVLFGPDGNGDGHQDLYVTSVEATGQGADKAKNGTVKRYDGVTGAFIDTFVATGQGGRGLDNPSGLTFSETDPVTLAYAGGSLMAAATPPDSMNERLRADEVQPVLTEAIAGWGSAGFDTSALHYIDLRIADIGGATLGLASGSTIWLDDNAAGWGWFVDPTPWDDSEFTMPGDPLTLPSPQSGRGDAWNKMDLLTALAHEIGQLLGHDHEEVGVMADTLDPGIRRTPGSTTVNGSSALLDVLISVPLSKRRR